MAAELIKTTRYSINETTATAPYACSPSLKLIKRFEGRDVGGAVVLTNNQKEGPGRRTLVRVELSRHMPARAGGRKRHDIYYRHIVFYRGLTCRLGWAIFSLAKYGRCHHGIPERPLGH